MSATTTTPKARAIKTGPDESKSLKSVPEAAPAAAIDEGKSEMTDTVKESVKETTAAASTMFNEFNERAKAAVEKSQKLAEELVEFHKGNVEAIVSSGKLAAKSFETIGQDAAELGRKNFESAQAAFKGFSAAKSPTELLKLQSDYAKSSFDSMVAQTSKNTEATLKLFGEIFQPISNRFAVAADRFKSAM
ncbi:phasin family protein [Sphingomonas sp. C3-2]|uniref:phasin family protein n=1 Tax=Sphingomonas sp. C3-2 TaxID=3062169 RepID=UPI00294B55CA|nr:phasin family protein [Sphingomonas sp. C3-2]WOK37825.1 phasin family protein [Sphingomonas sp. C3-2]